MTLRDGFKGALRAMQQAISKTLGDLPLEAEYETNIGLHHALAFSKSHNATDLDEAIRATRRAVDMTPKSDSAKKSRRLGLLATHLATRHSTTGAISDLDEAVRVTQEAVNAIPEVDSPHRLKPLTDLGEYLLQRSQKLRAVTDAEGAREALQKALDIDKEQNSSGHWRRLGLLGIVLGEKASGIHDLEDAIRILREAIVHATLKSSPSQNALRKHLGARLVNRYDMTGTSSDLDEAIQVTRDALVSSSAGHEKGQSIENLGGYLYKRFLRTQTLADLQDAISLTQEALSSGPQGHSRREARLYQLSLCFWRRYLRTNSNADLQEAERLAQEAVEITPGNDPKPADLLQTLKDFSKKQTLVTESRLPIERKIQNKRQILAETSRSDSNRGVRLLNLGIVLGQTGILSDAEEAIVITVQALEQLTEGDPRRASWLCTLASHFVNKWMSTNDLSDLEHAIPYLQSALLSLNSPIVSRIDAGREILWISGLRKDWEVAYEAGTTTLRLVPSLAPQSLTTTDKQHVLSQISGLACDAAAVALRAGKGPRVAMELLEQGRGVLAASIEDMQVDVVDLRRKHPSLAEEFVRLRDSLSSPAVSDSGNPIDTPSSRQYASLGQRHDLGWELEKLIDAIRERPGFENFLQMPTGRDIRAATKRGPIVFVNISKHGCDAIIVAYERLESVSLPLLSIYELEDKIIASHRPTIADLEWLWYTVAEPILVALGFTECPMDDGLPHIWWIPTGLMTKFPLHAAGCHRDGSGRTVLDRVMSSYSSSIRAMISSRKQPAMKPTSPEEALLIGMNHTPDHSPLHFVTDEVDRVRDICKMMGLDPINPGRRKQEVLSHLPYCRIFHFAGHAHADNTDPSQSYLVLNDWKQDRLTVASFIELNLRGRLPFLAYLSACGTGQMNERRLLDENIHLASACQLAGFRHVIGTLWEVNDESCAEIARRTYEEMKDNAISDESVCRGLHKATKELRGHWLNLVAQVGHRNQTGDQGELNTGINTNNMSSRGNKDKRLPRDVVLYGSNGDGNELTKSLNWVPYLHFGA